MSARPKDVMSEHRCPECGRPAVLTRSRTQRVCVSASCDWYERVGEAPPLAGLRAKLRGRS